MELSKIQTQDLKSKLGQVEEIIGFPINKRQQQQVEDIRRIKVNVTNKEKENGDLPIPLYFDNFLAETAINLFEEYLNEES